MVKLSIDGMHCGGCASTVEKSLKTVKGVTEVSVDLASKSATIQGTGLTSAALIAALAAAGYEAKAA